MVFRITNIEHIYILLLLFIIINIINIIYLNFFIWKTPQLFSRRHIGNLKVFTPLKLEQPTSHSFVITKLE